MSLDKILVVAHAMVGGEMISAVFALLGGLGGPIFVDSALAASAESPSLPPPREEDELPIPTLDLDRIPPRWSYEFGMHISYGQVAYFQDSMPPWIGFGFRTGMGWNVGKHRVGPLLTLSGEGDVGVHSFLSLEPTLSWDYVSYKQLALGVSVGPSFDYANDASTSRAENRLGLAPVAAVRVGWSQTWSRVGRRLFIVVEPKVRIAEGRAAFVGALVFGSGRGR